MGSELLLSRIVLAFCCHTDSAALYMQRSDEERAELRARSAASLVNIDPQERARRVTLGAGIVMSRCFDGGLPGAVA